MLHLTRNVQETYHFPILKPQAIVSCMSDVQVPCTEDDLARPTPQKVLVVYEAFMDVATGCVKDDCYLDDIQEMKIVQHPVGFFLSYIAFSALWKAVVVEASMTGTLTALRFFFFCFF